jgi:hypothetical protein
MLLTGEQDLVTQLINNVVDSINKRGGNYMIWLYRGKDPKDMLKEEMDLRIKVYSLIIIGIVLLILTVDYFQGNL